MPYDIPIQGGVDPAAATETDLLVTTANAVATVTATNRTNASINIRIGVATGGGALGDTEYDLFDFPLPAFDSIKRGPFSLPNGDDIRVQASAVDVTFRYDGWVES